MSGLLRSEEQPAGAGSADRRRAVWEVGAVLATALLQPVFVDVLHLRAIFIGLALGGWAVYFGMRQRREPGAIGKLGLRREGFGPSFLAASAFGVPALLVMIVIGLDMNTVAFQWQMFPLLALYPVWGTVQQLLLQGVFVRAIAATGAGLCRKFTAVALGALLFGAVHLPDVKLAMGTFVLGGVFALIYLRWRNLWPLGLYHGWLGVFAYYWVLGRDPWVEMFGAKV